MKEVEDVLYEVLREMVGKPWASVARVQAERIARWLPQSTDDERLAAWSAVSSEEDEP